VVTTNIHSIFCELLEQASCALLYHDLVCRIVSEAASPDAEAIARSGHVFTDRGSKPAQAQSLAQINCKRIRHGNLVV
jgi:hypothetical protein